jgi:hypothetical protein
MREGSDRPDSPASFGRRTGERRWAARLLPAVLAVFVESAEAHSGGLDRKGCHTNRKTNEYHCHQGSAEAAAADAPQQAARPKAEEGAARTDARAGPFDNCSEARAAGAAPIARGEPGYAPHLDRDNDGIACEPYRGR